MANGKPSDPEAYVIRSGVRSGLKREFAFALRSQADLPLSLGRTRSGKSSPAPLSRVSKKIKKSDPRYAPPESPNPPPLPEIPMDVVVDGETDESKDNISPVKEEEDIMEAPVVIDANDGPQKDRATPRRLTRSALKAAAEGTGEAIAADGNLGSRTEALMDGPKEDLVPPENESIVDTPIAVVNVCNDGSIENSIEVEKPAESMAVLEDSAAPIAPPIDQAAASSETSMTIDDNQEPKGNSSFAEGLSRRFTPKMEQEGSTVETPIVVSDQNGPKDGSGIVEKPVRRFTRSAIKAAVEDAVAGEVSATTSCRTVGTEEMKAATTSGGSVGSDEMKGGACNADDGSSSTTPSKKMELKMSKKIALNKLPSNVRELLGTGLLEGLPVKYITTVGKRLGLDGVIKGNGILCSCTSCKGSKVVSAYNFELHAGSTKKHPSDFIFLENGKSLHDVVNACNSAPLEMLETEIQNATGPLPPKTPTVCHKCKELFLTPRSGKFALLCDSCLEPKQHQPRQHQTNPSPFQVTSRSAKLPSKVLATSQKKSILPTKVVARDSSDGTPKTTPSQKKCSLPTKFVVGDASDGTSKNTSSQKKSIQGKLTRKDLGLHKLVFMGDILAEGTEVGYYVRGKRLLEGYIKDSGIYCRCCGSVVSPSQFEAHAGRASRRKPYNNIYTSNGVSLHELSVSLSKDRKLSSSENDDLCSICADGGDLLLCDLCPRAFHKECVGLSSIPTGDWYCRYCQNLHQREKCLETNDNAIAAGRIAGVDPIEQIITRSIRIVTTSTDVGGCVLCRCHDFSKSSFDERTVLLCDQCEKEYHVGCLKDHDMCDLKELPEGEWFCCTGCSRIHAALQDLIVRGSEPVLELHTDTIRKKREEKGLHKDTGIEIRWRLLSGKTSSEDSKLLLSKAVSIFHESFDPIVDAVTGRDLIPSIVYGRSVRDQDFGGMYCVVLTVNSSVVSAGILRVLGSEVAELPLVATNRECQGQGYFQSLFSCIERLLESLKVKHFVLPAAEEALSIWTKKFGFGKISPEQLNECTKGARPMIFQGTTMLHKPVPLSQGYFLEGQGS